MNNFELYFTWLTCAVVVLALFIAFVLLSSIVLRWIFDILSGIFELFHYLFNELGIVIANILDDIDYKKRKKQSDRERLEYYKDHPEDMVENRTDLMQQEKEKNDES